MSTQTVETFLDENAVVLVKKSAFLAWVSPNVRDNHLTNAEQRRVFSGLFQVLEMAFLDSAAQLQVVSPPLRIVNDDIPALAFLHYRPESNGASYMMIIERQNESRAWAEELRVAFEAEG